MVTKKTVKANETRSTDTTAEIDSTNDRAKAVRKARKDKVTSDVADVTVEKIAGNLTKTGLEINRSLNSIKEAIEKEVSNLELIKEAIAFKTEELEALHGKEIVAKDLDDLKADYENKRIQLETEIAEAKDAWSKEHLRYQGSIAERDDTMKKIRQREVDEYEYNKKISRQKDSDTWADTIRKREIELSAKDHESKTLIKERMDTLNAFETELKKMAEQAKKDKTEAETLVDTKVKEAEHRLHAEYGNKARFAKLESDNELNLLRKERDSLNLHVQTKDHEIAALRDQITQLQSQVKEIAVASMESASGKQALSAVQQAVQGTAAVKK
jgi:colicin import membrane protein